ncbi:cyclopropane-fatty-acyl-phospholipid synthase family protein [Alphaproteobacteria bacterium]|nr:cyclopropane-fatty-acyl-phospholipid synthase family protein [Alphaproteobacteria bacterium]
MEDYRFETALTGLTPSERVIFFMLKRLKFGLLEIHLPDGRSFCFGQAKKGQDSAVINVRQKGFFTRLLRKGSNGFAEGYMNADWDTPDLANLLLILNKNMSDLSKTIDSNKLTFLINRIIHILRPNTRSGSKKNIHAHYDLGNDFYSLWLDSSMTYSSARFSNHQMSLREAQDEKYRRLAKSANIGPDDHVLEIGCGWGGFAEFAAKEIGCKVTGITISKEQLAYGQERIAKAGLQSKVELKFCDYRDVREKYDRIVSVEMFEAVGESYWPSYFSQLKNCLKPGGMIGLQIITIANERFESYRKRADFIQRYIFPGGMLPSPEKLTQSFDGAGLALVDQLDFGTDYARTLKEWRHKFIEAWPKVEKMGFDARFRNMWEYYMAYCEAGFSSKSIDVTHFTLSHND